MKKIILGLVIVLGFSFCAAGIVSAGVHDIERFRGAYNETMCSDTDGGRNAFVKGTTCLEGVCMTDECVNEQFVVSETYGSYLSTMPSFSGGKLTEYYCGDPGADGFGSGLISQGIVRESQQGESMLRTSTFCENRCEDGACIERANPYCIGEGERSPQAGMSKCCPGLVARRAAGTTILGEECVDYHTGFAPGMSFPGTYNLCVKCGDGVCDTRYENTCICPEDCGAGAGLEDGETEPAITQPVCGNNVCETGEDEDNCPEDCETTQPESANIQIVINMIQQLIQDMNKVLGLLGNLL